MKKHFAALAASVLALGAAAPALADANEVLFIANVSETESVFTMMSYRRALSGDVDDGLKLRFDATYSGYPLIGDDASVTAIRLGLGYAMPVSDITTITLTAGVSQEWSNVNDDVTGFFVTGELWSDFASGSELSLIAEYASPDDMTYTSASYLFGMGDLKVGPTANYLTEDGYERAAGGLSVAYDIAESSQIKLTGAYAEQSIEGGDWTAASYVELAFTASF